MAESKIRVLVVGAGGFLGRALCELPCRGLSRVAAVREVRPPYTDRTAKLLDITNSGQVAAVVAEVRPAWVINAAAMTSVDGCEQDPEQAQRVHVEGTKHLARACEAAGSGLITLSTNYVFDGNNGPYGESDPPRPLNVYGQTKLEGEKRTLEAGCPGVVVRTAVLYGYREGCRPNFVTWAAGSLAKGLPIRVVSDEWANPTAVEDLAGFLLGLCCSDCRGIVHFAGPDYFTRYEMVMAVCDCFGLDPGLVSPITSAELGQPARRPLRAGLKVALAGRFVPDGRLPFREHLERIRSRVATPADLA